jgi:hypothetical protein
MRRRECQLPIVGRNKDVVQQQGESVAIPSAIRCAYARGALGEFDGCE